ncbi:protein phosphatase 1 regulatory subunit 37-like [Mya arenaria]|uniref:protein phosphatase 1 regulatory subunit 37-like n=1 Tax=Mya arenaria TaxID=6604 RepID=UPI0022E743A2|nr:protein phosphatase 1 regulatory subunit 37-like [Mya arenaria]
MDENQKPALTSTDVQNTGDENEPEKSSPSFSKEEEVNKPVLDTDPETVTKIDDVTKEVLDKERIGSSDSDQNLSNLEKKDKRKVSFPVDSKIVKDFLEPPDPWKNVPEWRTEDLIKAYKTSCERHGTKPLSKILKQLGGIENVGERYEILSLKGERLDMRQCESLEDILRHVRFRCIDLEATHLDDEMAVAIFEMVEYYESASKLNISFNKGIGPRGWQSCSKLVRKTPCLTFVDARSCDLNERVIPIFGRALRMGCFLQRLHLQSANLAGRALVILVAALKMNEVLKELFIGDNKFTATDGVQIGNLLKYNHKLELLDLRNNHLQDVGVGHVCDGLAEQCLDSGLLTLVLWNNQVTFQAMNAINKALTTAEHLETLNLGHNPITNEGIHILKDGLLKTKLLKLGLSGTKVSCEGAVALAEVIADNNKLVRVDLQENDIKTAGLMALSLALKVNETITRLDVDRDTKKESGVKDYAEQQKRLQKDIASCLERNRDIFRKLEDEKRLLEEKNQENARKLEEASEDLTESSEYIPSGDTIHRPKLLFIPQPIYIPEHELDSPVLGQNFEFEEFNFESTSGVTKPKQLSVPQGADLLSPQYCANPKATAKKIFSVTKVTSPLQAAPLSSNSTGLPGFSFSTLTSAVNSVINSPTQVHPPVGRRGDGETLPDFPQICPPLATVDVQSLGTPIPITVPLTSDASSPNSLQKVIEEQTLVTYIQQIVDAKNITSELPKVGDSNVVVDAENKTSELPKVDDLNVVETDNGVSELKGNSGPPKVDDPHSVETVDVVLEPKSNSDAEDNVSELKKSSETLSEDSVSEGNETVENCDVETSDNHVKDAIETNGDTVECDNSRLPEDNNIEVKPESKEGVDSVSSGASGDGSDLKVETGVHKEETVSVNDDVPIDHPDDIDDKENNGLCVSVKDNVQVDHPDDIDDKENSDLCVEKTSVENTQNITESSNNACSSADNEAGSNVWNNNRNIAMGSSPQNLSIVVCDVKIPEENILSAKKNDETCDDQNEDVGLNGDFVDCFDQFEEAGDKGVGNIKENDKNSLDSEPWNSLNDSDFSDNVNGGIPVPTPVGNKPDFHTNLSFNGLQQELASLIDEESSLANGSVKSGKCQDAEPVTH